MIQSFSDPVFSKPEYLNDSDELPGVRYLIGPLRKPVQHNIEPLLLKRPDSSWLQFDWKPMLQSIYPVLKAPYDWGWWKMVKEQVDETMARLEKEAQDRAQQQYRLGRSIHSVLGNHKSLIATGLIVGRVPTASATGETKSDPPVARTRNPIFEFKRPYDYVLLGFMVVYLGTALYLRARTAFYDTGFRASYALTISLGALAFIVNRDEFATPIRTTVLEIWFPAAIHVAVQFCYDNYNPTRHILYFLGLSTIVALALYQFPTISLLDILPPYVAVVALVAMAVQEVRNIVQQGRRPVARDEETADQGIVLEDRADGEQSGVQVGQELTATRTSEQTVRRTSMPSPTNSCVFTIGDDTTSTSSHVAASLTPVASYRTAHTT